MRSGKILIATIAVALFTLKPVLAMPDNERLSIEAMGDLNGVALICRYPEIAKRLKLGMIENLPKVREYGALFDSQTNVSYLDFVNTKKKCPAKAEFSEKVDAAIMQLKSVFKK